MHPSTALRPAALRGAITVLALVVAMLGLPVAGVHAAGVEPGGVATVRAGIGTLAEGFIADYEEAGPLAQPVLLSDSAPGADLIRPGDALDLGTVMAQGITQKLVDLQSSDPKDTLAGFAEQVDTALDATIGGAKLEVSASDLVTSGDPGFHVVITVSKTVDGVIALTDPNGPGGEPVTLKSTPDAPFNLSFTFGADVRTNSEADRFWLVAGDSGPTVHFGAGLSGGGAYQFPQGQAAIGVGDVAVLPGSTVDLDASWDGGIVDSNTDGRLAMFEPTLDGTSVTPGELSMPVQDLTTFGRTGHASASVKLGSDMIPLDASPAPALTLDADLATALDLNADLVASSGDAADFEAFTRLSPADLVTGLTQYAALLRALQTHDNVDAALPLTGGRLSDLYDLGARIQKLADDLIVVTPWDDDADPTDDQVKQVVEVGVQTIGDLADKLAALPDFSGGTLQPTYDSATQRVTIDASFSHALDGLEALHLAQGSEVAQLTFGDQLRGSTGLRGVSAPDNTPIDPNVDVAYDVDLPILIDLAPSQPATADDPATPAVEFETPMVYERFETKLVPGTEISLTELVDTTTAAQAQIGIVPATVGGTYRLKQDGANPTTVADVDPGNGATDTPRLVALIGGLYGKDGQPAAYPVAVADRHAVVDADLTMSGRGARPQDVLTAQAGTFSVDGTGFSVGGYTTALTNDEATMLRSLDVDSAEPTRLLGRVIDTAGAVADSLDSVDSALGSDGPTIPLVNRTTGALLRQAVDLKGGIDTLRSSATPLDLGQLESAMQGLVGAPDDASSVAFSLRDLDPDPGTVVPSLVLRFDVTGAKETTVPLTLDTGGLPNLTGSGDEGSVKVRSAASLDLGVVVPLQPEGDPVPPVRVLDGSEFSVTGTVTESEPGSAQFKVNLGALSAQLGDSVHKTGRLAVGVKLAVGHDGAPDPASPSEAPVSLSDFFGPDLDIGVTSGSPDGHYTCAPGPVGPVTGTFGCATLPVLTTLSGTLKTIGLNDPASPTADDYLTIKLDTLDNPEVVAPANLSNVLADMDFSFDGLSDGFDALAKFLKVAIAASSVGGDIPVVGEDLTKVAGGLTDLQTFLGNPGATLDLPTGTVQQVLLDNGGLRDKLTKKLGTDLGILRDSAYQPYFDGDPNPAAASDIRIVAVCDGVPCLVSQDAVDIDEVRVEMELGQGSRGLGNANDPCVAGNGTTCSTGVELPIDLGLPGLPLSLKGKSSIEAGWTVELGFGVSRTDGFFLLDNPVPGTNMAAPDGPGGDQEIRAKIGADLFTGTTPKLDGTIGFVNLEAKDHSGKNSGAHLIAQVGLDTPGCVTQGPEYSKGVDGTYCTGLIPGSQLLGGDPSSYLTDVRLQGGVDIDADIKTSIGNGTVAQTMPEFNTEFVLLWQFDSAQAGDLPAPSTLELRNVQVAPGELMREMFGKVFNEINKVLEPTQEVRDFLFTPIPVISDISEYFDQGTIAMIDIARLYGVADTELLKDTNKVLNFVTTIANMQNGPAFTIADKISFDTAAAAGPPKSPDQVSALWTGASTFTDPAQLESKVEAALGSDLTQKWHDLGATESSPGEDGHEDFEYPVFKDSKCLSTLLLGGDCSIVEWRPDDLKVKASYPVSFGPFFGVLYVTFGGEIEANANLGAGVSTRGIRLLAEDLLDGTAKWDAGTVSSVFLQSLYLLDLDRAGKDVPEFAVRGAIKVGAKFDALIVAAGVDGGIEATFSMNLNDTPEADGRMHIDELIAKFKTPICLFDLEGKLKAFLEVWVRFGICPFCHTETWRVAEVTLFEWKNKCDEPEPPNLADSVSGVVYLNVGSRAPQRGSMTDVTAESYVVRQLTDKPDGSGNYKFRISAFGFSEEETGARIEIPDAAGDDDAFQFVGGGSELVDGEPAAAGTTGATWPFTARVDAHLGAGNDSFKSGEGTDNVWGGGDNDQLNLGNGTNTAYGDGGDDTIMGGRGVDEIHGGGDNDVIDGGLAADRLYGDGGLDKIHGGHDILVVPPGQTPPPNSTTQNQYDVGDLIVGGSGNDTLSGGSGDDTIHGDEEVTGHAVADDYAGSDADSPGNDLIEGGGGSDTVFAGRGADVAQGGFILASDGQDQSQDKLQGNGGDDRLYGSYGDDLLYGGPDADRVFGEDGKDQGHGQSGNDPEVRGGNGADQLWGGGGDDSVFGDGDDDEIVGDGDGAVLDGADAATKVGSDTTDGGTGKDIVLGDNGTVSGPAEARVANPSQTDGAGDASLGGGAGDDRIYGEGGGDTMYGGADRDLLHGNGGEDVINGQTGADEAWGDADSDQLYGGTEDDVVFGNGAHDTIHGQEGADLLVGGHDGPTGADTRDTLFGGPENDRIYGDDVTITKGANNVYDASDPVAFDPSADASTYGNDTADGGTGLDEIHGQDGSDDLWGAEDADQIFGELGSDYLHGEGGPDYLVGDRGTITPGPREVVAPAGGWKPGTPLGSPVLQVALVAPVDGDTDYIWGDFDSADDPWSTGGDDHAWGGAGDDVMRGGSFDDTMEGNNGTDRMFGFDVDSDDVTDGEDDLIGGSSPVNPLADPDGANSAPDEGETEMQGNGQEDVMAGDNAIIERVADPDDATKWKVDPVTGGVFRKLTLLDTEKRGAALDLVSGGDYMVGNDENDRMFGEGGPDLVKGNANDDLVEGNLDRDWLEGNDDEDDLIGGSSFPDQPDAGDVLWGGGGADVLAGDNTCLVRQADGVPFEPASCEQLDTPAPDAFDYVTSQLGVQTPRGVVLHDVDAPDPSEFGADELNGGSGVDVEFGQDGTDFLFGDGGADFQHGNGDSDVVVGDRPVDEYDTVALPPEVVGTLPTLPTLPSGLPGTPSTGTQLVGPPEADGQDDQLGGSNKAGHRDAGDWIFGDGEADFQLGDNGELNRTVEGDHYAVYEERYAGNNPPPSAVIERDVTRYDVGTPASAGVWGADLIFGGDGTNPLISQGGADGDDSQWGQDGNDQLFGEDGDDDQFGELGNDTMWGGAGEDAMVGDRGGVQTRYVEDDGSDSGDPLILTHNSLGPPGINLGGPDAGPQDAVLKPFTAHPLDRRTSLSHDRDGSLLELGGHDVGGIDRMRGGPGHDSMHGAEGNDIMNGDSGGDYVYGDDGADVMWGGRGRPEVFDPDIPSRNDPGVNGQWIDVLFGGYGTNNTVTGADIIDYQPRPNIDPPLWFEMVKGYADTAPGNNGVEGRQHHHGTDWEYGGWDRDILQGDVTANGPNDGDKLLDWNGAYNLYTHCNAAYGGWNDVRKIDPNNIEGLNRLAYVTGAAADFDGRPVLADVTTPGTSAYREVAVVYSQDVKSNSGAAFPTTPGHFQDFICSTD